VGNYVALTKPRIIELLLVTTLPAMFLAQRGLPSLWLIVSTLVGGTFSAASANTLNCYLDRDIDAVMHRTENRPLITGAISPPAALRFGAVLSVASTLWLGLLVNWLAAALHDAAQAPHVTEHRVGRRCGLYAGAHRLVCRHQLPGVAGACPVPDRVLLDPAALLAVVDALQGRVRGGRGTHAPGGCP